jgi:hypothetical protein
MIDDKKGTEIIKSILNRFRVFVNIQNMPRFDPQLE